MNYFEASNDFPNGIGIFIALLKFRGNVFHPTPDLLTEKTDLHSSETDICFNGAFVPFVSTTHQLSNLRCMMYGFGLDFILLALLVSGK